MSKNIFIILCIVAVIVISIYLNLCFNLPWWSFLIVGVVIGILAALMGKKSDKPKKGDRHDF